MGGASDSSFAAFADASSMAKSLVAAVPFVHPGIAAAALACGAIPILIHILHRRRFRRVPWAAMRFLKTATQRSAKRLWLEHWLLLLTRVAVIVLLGFAVARPYLATTSLSSAGARVHRIVVVDDSLSMSARGSDGRTRFEVARESALRLLSTFPAGDAVSLVRMASPAKAVIAYPAYDRRFVREQFEAMASTERAADTVGAISAAAKILRESNVPGANRTVYLVTDLPAREWRSEAGSTTPAADALRALAEHLEDPARNLVLVPVAETSPPNVAITSIVPETSLVGVGVPVRLTVELQNFGPTIVRDLLLQLRRLGAIIRSERVPPIPAGQSVQVSLTTAFAEAGVHGLEARVANMPTDALSADDSRYLSVEARASTGVLLVDGRPGAIPLQGEAGFLATALSPKVLGDVGTGAESPSGRAAAGLSAIEPKIIAESDFATEPLHEYDLVALCNVARPTAEAWRNLEAYVSRGGGLLISAGDLVSVDDYNRLGYRGGSGLLPALMGRAVDGRAADGTLLGFRIESRHSSVAEFRSHAASGLFTARVDRVLPVELSRGRGEVLVQYTNGLPAAILSRFGLGNVLLWTTTMNMEWTNLPAKGDFVSLVLNLASNLVAPHGADRNLAVGGTLRERLSASEVALPLRVSMGGAALAEPSLVNSSGSLAAEYGPVDHAGLVQMTVGPGVRAFAVNPSATESDLRPLEEREAPQSLRCPYRWAASSALLSDDVDGRRAAELSTPVIVVVLGLLFGELWIAVRWGVRSRPPSRPGTRDAGSPLTGRAVRSESIGGVRSKARVLRGSPGTTAVASTGH